MKRSARYAPTLATALVLAVLYSGACVRYPGFFTVRVFINLLADNSFVGIIAVGMTLVIISGGIDLSVGAVMALCATAMAALMQFHHVPAWLAMLAALAVGGSIGFAVGCAVHYLRIAPFIVTLAGMFLARGLAQSITLETIAIRNETYSDLVGMNFGAAGVNVPLTAVVFLAVVAVGIYTASYTPFGRNLYALGGSENAANLMGLPVARTRIAVYVISGVCSGLAAIVFTIYQSAASPVAGMGMELDAIAVTVIGGTLLQGGYGSVFGTLLGVLILGVIQSAIVFEGSLNSWWIKVAIGGLLLAFVLLQKVLAQALQRKA